MAGAKLIVKPNTAQQSTVGRKAWNTKKDMDGHELASGWHKKRGHRFKLCNPLIFWWR
jgi:hypothetical protein